MELFEKQGLTQSNKVILAGANKEIFNKEDYILGIIKKLKRSHITGVQIGIKDLILILNLMKW